MSVPPTIVDDDRRVACLRTYEVLDSLPEEAYDSVVRLVAAACATPAALVTLIDAERQFCKSTWGIPGRDTPRETSLCAHTIATPDGMLVVNDTARDPRFRDHPLVLGPPFVRFYAGVTLRSPDGFALGSICTFDTVPRELTAEQTEMLRSASSTIVALLEARRTALALARASRAERAVRARLEPLEAFAGHASDGVLVLATPADVGTLAHVVYANAAFERLTGSRARASDAIAPSEVFADRRDALAFAAALQGVAPFARASRAIAADGTVATLEIRLSPVSARPDERPSHWIVLVRDVADRERADREKLRAEAMSLANAELERELERRRNVERHLSFAAQHDALTGLPNRRFFVERLQARVTTPGARFAVMFVDLDAFKAVNDTHGHLLGDDVLAKIAHRLQRCVRDHDVVARLGGDEFTALVDRFDDVASLQRLARRLLRAVGAPCRVGAGSVALSASIGIVIVDGAHASAEDVLRDADAAMFRAKNNGKNRFEFFGDAVPERAVE